MASDHKHAGARHKTEHEASGFIIRDRARLKLVEGRPAFATSGKDGALVLAQVGNDLLGALKEEGHLPELTALLGSYELELGVDSTKVTELSAGLGALLHSLAQNRQALCARLQDPWHYSVIDFFPQFLSYGSMVLLKPESFPPEHVGAGYSSRPAGVQFCVGFLIREYFHHIDLLYPSVETDPMRGRESKSSPEPREATDVPAFDLSREALTSLRGLVPDLFAKSGEIEGLMEAREIAQRNFARGLEPLLQGMAGRSLGTLEANRSLVAEITKLLRAAGLRCICPSCGQPAALTVVPGNSPAGVFKFDHGRGPERGPTLRHGGKASLPRLELVAVGSAPRRK